jgi:hypothetical protein
MPNYVTCGFFVTGNPQELERFQTRMIVEVPVSPFEPDDLGQLFPSAAAAAGIASMVTFDFNGIIPMLPGLTHLEQKRWAVENWGTKWNAQDYILVGASDLYFSCVFCTAWDFPTPVFEALATEFPNLIFDGFAYEEQGEFNLAGQWNGDCSWGPIDPDQNVMPDHDEDEEF